MRCIFVSAICTYNSLRLPRYIQIHARTNNYVHIEDDSGSESETPIKTTKRAKATPKTTVKTEVKMPALALPKSRKVKTEQTSSMATLVGTPSSRTPSSDGADGMPVFLAAQWQGVVVPALYRALNCSSSPCEVGLQGTTTVKLVQAVINKLYPGNTYEVKWNDAVCAKAAARLMEYRSFIGTAGMDTVAAYIAETPLLNTNSLELKKYARYANKPGGPALFKAPPPPDAIHIQDPKDPIYVKPRGFLESPMFVSILAPLLKTLSEDRPVGAMALAAASLERAWNSYKSGSYEKPGKFTKAEVGGAVAGYLVSISKLSDAAWDRIMGACNDAVEQVQLDQSDDEDVHLDGHRENLYVPSSPL
ncbi:hypothetical protein C8J57DRAFT_1728958 [Mycena rebaudengoi]|nr:hypothetical protein C8J57DRAFT_1728958 [Mycena rebaudengoi]